MTSCEQVIQGVWEFLDREMTDESIKQVQVHLELCRSCFSRMEFERLLRDRMRNQTNHGCPEALKRRIRAIIETF
jgi:anti-sigma factor (TIGR02949 family)